MEGVGAYGGGKAGGTFDFIAFAKRPQVVLRLACWVSNNVLCMSGFVSFYVW